MKKTKKLLALVLATIMAGILFAGCVGNSKKSESLKWYIFDNPSNTNAKQVYEELNKKIYEKVGAHVEFVPIISGNYEAKMQVLNATAEQMDIVFVSNWLNNYYNNVAKNTLLPLDDLLKTTPKLYETIPDYFWDGAKVNGKIYAVPNQQIAAREARFAIPEQNVKLLGIDVNEFMSRTGNYKTYLGAADEYLRLLNSKTNTYAKLGEIWSDGLSLFNMEEVVGSRLPGAIRYADAEDGSIEIINQYKSDEFKYYINLRRQWVKEGLVQSEIEDTRALPGLTDENVIIPALYRVNVWKPGVEQDILNSEKYMAVPLVKTEGWLTSGGIAATMMGISSTSKNPELALKVLELVNTDKEIYNLLVYGIEGVNYEKIGENRIKIKESPFYSLESWAAGNVYNGYLLPTQADDTWEETKKINDSAKRSPLLGFSPILDNVKTEVAACSSALDEFLKVLDYGVVDVDTAYSDFINKLDVAGADKIIAEVQAQVNEWLKTK